MSKVTDLIDELNGVPTHEANTNIHYADVPSDGNGYIRRNKAWVQSAAGGQFLGGADVGSVMFTSQTTDEALTLVSGTNGLVVDSLEVLDGGSITIEDGAVLKVV